MEESRDKIFSGTLFQKLTVESLAGFICWFVYLIIMLSAPIIGFFAYKYIPMTINFPFIMFCSAAVVALVCSLALWAISRKKRDTWSEILVPLLVLSIIYVCGYALYSILSGSLVPSGYYETLKNIMSKNVQMQNKIILPLIIQNTLVSVFVAFMMYAAGKYMIRMEDAVIYTVKSIGEQEDGKNYINMFKSRFDSFIPIFLLLLISCITYGIIIWIYNYLPRRPVLLNYATRLGVHDIELEMLEPIANWSVSMILLPLLMSGILVIYLSCIANRWTYIWKEGNEWRFGLKFLFPEQIHEWIDKWILKKLLRFRVKDKEVYNIRIRPNPYHGDRLGGLKPLISTYYMGQILLAIGVGIISPEIVAFWYPELYLGEFDLGISRLISGIITLVVIGIVIVIIFAWITYVFHRVLVEIRESKLRDLYSIHARLIEEKEKILRRLSEQLKVSTSSSASIQRTSSIGELIKLVEDLEEAIKSVTNMIEFVESIPRWPISFRVSAATTGAPPITFSLLTMIGRAFPIIL